MIDEIESAFSRLRGAGYHVTSPRTDRYNCIAWAAGDTTRWWWPDGRSYWPHGVARAEALSAFRDAFAMLGYDACAGAELEMGFEKVALFADREGIPTHAARQLPNGRWTSKLGLLEDVEHALGDLEGGDYGSVVLVMKRPRPT